MTVNEQACKKAMSYLDYETAVTIGSYIGEIKEELKRAKSDYEELKAANERGKAK